MQAHYILAKAKQIMQVKVFWQKAFPTLQIWKIKISSLSDNYFFDKICYEYIFKTILFA